MDDKTLHRLLMDRALGALPADAAALLSAYLAHAPAAAARARQFEAAAAAARRALQQPTPELPAFPTARLLALETARRRLRVLRYAAGLAAMLVIGIGLGFSVAAREKSGGVGPRPSPIPLPLREAGQLSVPHGTFWSTIQMYENARLARREDTTHWIWDSAVSPPRPGAKS
jgi:hypothetical protein